VVRLVHGRGNIGGMLGSFALGHLADHKGPRWGLYLSFAVLGVSLALFALPLSPGPAGIGFFGGGFFGAAYGTVNLYLMLSLAAPGQTTHLPAPSPRPAPPSSWPRPSSMAGWRGILRIP